MLNSEQIFRLSSIALLSLLFVSVTAIADKKSDPSQNTSPSIYSHISLVDEADMINSGAFHPSQLTTIGARSEVLRTSQTAK